MEDRNKIFGRINTLLTMPTIKDKTRRARNKPPHPTPDQKNRKPHFNQFKKRKRKKEKKGEEMKRKRRKPPLYSETQILKMSFIKHVKLLYAVSVCLL